MGLAADMAREGIEATLGQPFLFQHLPNPQVLAVSLKGAASLEEGLAVLKKYGISLTEEEMQKLTSKREMSDE